MRNLHKIGPDITEDLQFLARQWYQINTLERMPLRLNKGVLEYYQPYTHDWIIFPKEHQKSWVKEGRKNKNLIPFTSPMIEIIN